MVEALRLSTPLQAELLRKLRLGQVVLLSGLIYTARDKVHRYLYHERPAPEELPFSLKDGVLYHCGPLLKDGQVVSAGPTTSQRMQMYTPFVIQHYGIRALMGKGGMSGETLRAMKEHGCVYLSTIGGAGALLAQRIKGVKGVWMLETFGPPEALWALEVEDFPAVLTIDAHGRSLHEEIKKHSQEELQRLLSE
jgi:fumarate hydratase class I